MKFSCIQVHSKLSKSVQPANSSVPYKKRIQFPELFFASSSFDFTSTEIIFHVFTHATFRFFKPTAVLKLLRPHRKHSFSAPACLFSLTYFPSLHYSKHFLSTHCAWNISYLTHFMPLASVDTPWKQKTKGFLIFSGGIERDHWHEMC